MAEATIPATCRVPCGQRKIPERSEPCPEDRVKQACQGARRGSAPKLPSQGWWLTFIPPSDSRIQRSLLPVNLFVLACLEWSFCHFEWEESFLVCTDPARPVPACGVAPAGLNVHSEVSQLSPCLPSGLDSNITFSVRPPLAFSLNYAHCCSPYFPYQFLLYHVFYLIILLSIPFLDY